MSGTHQQLPPALPAHAARCAGVPLRTLGEGPREFLRGEAVGIAVDATRSRIDAAAFTELLTLAPQIVAARDAMLALAAVNVSEQLPACHCLYRAQPEPSGTAAEVWAQIAHERKRMLEQAARLRETTDTVIHLGIGGSVLGPQLACEAVVGAPGAPAVRFLASPDPAAASAALDGLAAERTHFVIASKTFTTAETLANATLCKDWLTAHNVHDVGAHFSALTAAPARAANFGLRPEAIFTYPACVGGRFSLWAQAALTFALHAGDAAHDALLAGARTMDAHFTQASPADNLPIMLALLHVWEHVLLGVPSRIVLPYPHRLRRLPEFLQQLLMESLGKRGAAGATATPVVWGAGSGAEAAHSVFQALHQGAQIVAADLIVSSDCDSPGAALLLAQALAQCDLLACGDDHTDAQRHVPGGRPATLFVLEQLDAHTLGALLALHEHVVVAIAAVLGVNAFDQFGVERGKTLTGEVAAALTGDSQEIPGTGLADLLRELRGLDSKEK